MASYILRSIDVVLWARVKAKAAREGTTVKAVIETLLRTWVGVLVLAVLASSCTGASPLGPSPTVTPPVTPLGTLCPEPLPTPIPPDAPVIIYEPAPPGTGNRDSGPVWRTSPPDLPRALLCPYTL